MNNFSHLELLKVFDVTLQDYPIEKWYERIIEN